MATAMSGHAGRLHLARLRGTAIALCLEVACVAAFAHDEAARQVPPPAYQSAALRAGIPSEVLYAVALQESGMRLRGRTVPWPWTLNIAGTPRRFATRAEACKGLKSALAQSPATRIDAGIGQINVGYHSARYAQPCELLDPYRNLEIAAQILREQHAPGADWLQTIGRYHRPAGGEPAARYRRSVQKHLTRVQPPQAPTPIYQANSR